MGNATCHHGRYGGEGIPSMAKEELFETGCNTMHSQYSSVVRLQPEAGVSVRAQLV